MLRKIAQTGNKICGKHLFLAQKFGGYSKTQTMQTADCRPCRPCRLCRPCWQTEYFFFNTWLTFLGSAITKQCSICPNACYLFRGRTANSTSDCGFNKRNVFNRLCMENSLYCSSIDILNSSIKIKFHTFWAQIASIFDGFVVLLRLSRLLLFSISLQSSFPS